VSATVYTMRAIHRRHPDYRSGGESTVTDETSTTIDDVGSRSSASRYREVPSRSSALRFALAGFVALVLGALLVAWIAHDLHAANARDLPLNRWFHDRAASGGVVHSLSEWVSWIGAGERTVPIELAFAGVLGVANGPSRLFLGKHWVTDILGAWLLGSAWLLLVWAAFLLWLAPRRDGEPPPPGDRVAGVPRS